MTSAVITAVFRVATASAQSAGPGIGYPYVQQGTNIIVHCDEYGGFRTDMLFSTRVDSKNTSVILASNENQKIPAQFEVKVIDVNYYVTVGTNVCGSGDWRMPTYKEALVTVLLNDELRDKMTTLDFVTITCFEDTGSFNGGCYVVSILEGKLKQALLSGNSSSSTKFTQALCVRDIDTSSLGFSDL